MSEEADFRRHSDLEIYETLGRIKQFMEESERERDETRESLRRWRESSASEMKDLSDKVASLESKLHGLTAPARWAIGIAAFITTMGAVVAFGKRFLIFIRDSLS